MNQIYQNFIPKCKGNNAFETHLNSLLFIYNYVKTERNKVLKISKKTNINAVNKNKLITNMRHISDGVYSWCDIVNCLFIDLFRDDIRFRGDNLKNSYNANFKKVYGAYKSGSSLIGIHNHGNLKEFYRKSHSWYIILHDIRTQETHYEVGKISKINTEYIYFNKNRNGVSKNLVTNPSDKIEISLKSFINHVDDFLLFKNSLEVILKEKL